MSHLDHCFTETQKFGHCKLPLPFEYPKRIALALHSSATHGPVSDRMSISFPAEEERILKHWKEIDAFRRQVELSEGQEPWNFYDGPPFSTGIRTCDF